MSHSMTRLLAWLAMLVALSVALPAAAQSLVGHWVLTADDTAVFAADIVETPRGPVLTWRHPEHFDSDGFSLRNASQGVVSDRSEPGVQDGNETSFELPATSPDAPPMRITLQVTDGDRLRFRIVGMPTALTFDRVAEPAQLGLWRTGASYDFEIHYPTNTEMTALFDADQADRHAPTIDWRVVGPADAARRDRTQRLLDDGSLASGEDFYHAAFVFQHGDKPDDYLKAHVLATVAAARGHRKAAWISAATLDRYLQAIDRPQVLGTQFQTSSDGITTQGEYDRALISDALRAALGVPSLADQERKRAEIQKRQADKKGDCPSALNPRARSSP